MIFLKCCWETGVKGQLSLFNSNSFFYTPKVASCFLPISICKIDPEEKNSKLAWLKPGF